MFKILILFILIVLLLIFFGNYYDLQREKISKKEYDRRTRLSIALVFIFVAILIYFLRK